MLHETESYLELESHCQQCGLKTSQYCKKKQKQTKKKELFVTILR